MLSRTSLELDPENVKLSCKTWERLKIAPWQTWFENILNLTSLVNFRGVYNKKKILGEWVHQCLQFELTPTHWETKIYKHVKAKTIAMEKIYHYNNEKMPYFLTQWLNQTTHMGIQIAKTCAHLLNDKWYLKSEWPLPHNKDILPGRIDLLAQDNPKVLSHVIVVDYKTAIRYLLHLDKLSKAKVYNCYFTDNKLKNWGPKILTSSSLVLLKYKAKSSINYCPN